MLKEIRLEAVRKRMQRVEGYITKAFTGQAGLAPVEIGGEYLFALSFTVQTDKQTFTVCLPTQGG